MSFLFAPGLTVILAVVGYWLLKKIKFPAPVIMGPMLLIGIVQVMGGGLPVLPRGVVGVFQIMMGLSLGARINDRKLADLRKVLRPSAVIAVWTLLSTFGMTFLIHLFTPNLATALFAAAPGGISEMTVLAMSYDSEVPVVSTYQFARYVVIISVVPFIIRWLKQKTSRAEQTAAGESSGLAAAVQETEQREAEPRETEQKETGAETRAGIGTQLLIYLPGILGGLLLLVLRFPGGGIIGAMAALAVTNVLLKKRYEFPCSVMHMALLGVGATIGLEFSPEIIQSIGGMLPQIIGFTSVIVLSNFLVGWYLQRVTQWDLITCLLSTAPGGLGQMLAAAEEMGADGLTVSILQLVRLLTIIVCIPLIATLIV